MHEIPSLIFNTTKTLRHIHTPRMHTHLNVCMYNNPVLVVCPGTLATLAAEAGVLLKPRSLKAAVSKVTGDQDLAHK